MAYPLSFVKYLEKKRVEKDQRGPGNPGHFKLEVKYCLSYYRIVRSVIIVKLYLL